MLARWYLLLGQFSVTFEYRPGAQHANAVGMSRQCGQCQRPDCPVSASDSQVADRDVPQVLEEQPFTSSDMGESMDTDLLPELSGETWVASTLLDGLTADLLPAGADLDLIVASRQDRTLATVREWVQSGNVPLWADCSGLSPELRCWRLQVGNLSIDMDDDCGGVEPLHLERLSLSPTTWKPPTCRPTIPACKSVSMDSPMSEEVKGCSSSTWGTSRSATCESDAETGQSGL